MPNQEIENKEAFECFDATRGEAETPSEVLASNATFFSNSFDYKPFGSDNLFPQSWEEYMKTSGTARSIVRRKTVLAVGEGYDREGMTATIIDYLDEINKKEESIEEVKEKVFSDYFRSGNAYIEIVKGEESNSVFHQDWTKCRYDRTGKFIIVHPNWAEYEVSRGKATSIPVYPNFGKVKGKRGLRSIIHIKNYEPEFTYYGIPDPVASKDAMAVGYRTTKWNRSRVDNGMKPSGILMLSGKYTPEQAEKIKKKTEKNLSGAGNQGKIITIIKDLSNGKEGSTEFIEAGTTATEGDWTELHKQADTEIIIGFNWFRSLTSLPYASGFSSDLMQNEYHVAMAIEIQPAQAKFARKLRKVFKKHLKIEIELKTINKSPFPIHLSINKDIAAAFKVGEVRSSAGYSFDEEDDYHNSYMVATKSSKDEDETTDDKKKESEEK
tara:strand:+ start:16022 stop:17338 length:1317 start_codon:yes stop_codon:yes gene_type:complete